MGRKYSHGTHSYVSAKLYRLSSSSSSRWVEDASPMRGHSEKCDNIYDHIRRELGVDFKGNKLPAYLAGTFYLDGVRFTVVSAAEKKGLIRTFVTCPKCEHTFAAGRSGQHVCKPKKLRCTGLWDSCPNKVNAIDNKGYLYCGHCADNIGMGRPVRQLTREEVNTLKARGTIAWRKAS